MSQSTARGLQKAVGLLASTSQTITPPSLRPTAGACLQHSREYAAPEFFGRPSHYTQGTDFLGTPPDHLEVSTLSTDLFLLTNKRPVSPHVFEIDNKGTHYKMPINAVSSITNRITGVVLSVGLTGAGVVALTGDLPATVAALKASYPFLVLPAKAAVAGPLVYHYLGGLRHLVWDKSKIGNQADKHSLLDLPNVDKSSYALFGASAVGTLGLALYSF